ncbi:MAG: DUF4329 domain-containing protein [Candidatus Acidiferrales bacterium]
MCHPPDQKAEFQTRDAAGTQAIDRVNSTSKQEDREYAGWIEKNKDGTYSIDTAKPGTQAGSDPGPKPSAAAADYHTHGANDARYDNEHFSPRDKQSVPGSPYRYLGTPSGAIKTYDPSTGQVRTLRKGTEP